MSDKTEKMTGQHLDELVPGRKPEKKSRPQDDPHGEQARATREWAGKFKADDPAEVASAIAGKREGDRAHGKTGRDQFPPIPPSLLRRPRTLLQATDPGKAMSFPIVGTEGKSIMAIPQDELHQLIDDCVVMVMHLFDSAGLVMPVNAGERLGKGLIDILGKSAATPEAIAGLYYKSKQERTQ